ncbi:MAG: glycosyltransferase [Candidatus Bathyarchaeia archaeon]
MKLPAVSILIPTKNNAKTIAQCLDSVMSLNYPKGNLEVHVIDAFSKDGTREILKKYKRKPSKFPLHVTEADLNVPKSYNMILKKARGELIGFLDGDAIVDRNWLRALVPNLKQPGIGGAGGIVYTQNRENKFARSVGYELQDRFENMPKYCTRLPTDNLIVKKDILRLGFDEHLYTGYDADLCYSIVKRGLLIVYDRKAKVFHYHRDTVRKFFKQQFHYGFNAIRLYLKHGSFLFHDTKTRGDMFIQPPIFLTASLLFVLGIIARLRRPPESILWLAFFALGGLVLALLLILYFVQAYRLARKFNDFSSIPRLLVIFITRMLAWTVGGIYGSLETIPALLLHKIRGSKR